MMKDSPGGTSRRDFVKSAAVAAGAVGALSACGNARTPTAPAVGGSPGSEAAGLPITVAGYSYDRVQALVDGRVKIDGCSLTYQKAGISDLNTHVFNGPQTIEVTEIGLHPYMLAFANDGFRGYSLLPVFPLRVFRHKSVFIRTDRRIARPEDLRGKRIATPGYSSTSLTWIRGIFEDEYGLRPEDVEWVVSSRASDASTGTTSEQENVLPDGVKITEGPAGVDESDLLVSGEVDAIFHATEPRAYAEGNPIVARLFSDFRRVEREYYAKSGIFPIMHAVAVRDDVIDANPWIIESVFTAYSRAKTVNDEFLRKLGWAMISAPWLAQELEETRALMGDNYWPYGIGPNRKTLEALFRYSHEQGLASRQLTVEEIFHPDSLGLTE